VDLVRNLEIESHLRDLGLVPSYECGLLCYKQHALPSNLPGFEDRARGVRQNDDDRNHSACQGVVTIVAVSAGVTSRP